MVPARGPSAYARAMDLLAHAERLRPRLAAQSAEIERTRLLPADLVAELTEAGFFHLCAPRSVGGSEVAPRALLEILETLGRGDSATGWCVMVGGTASFLGAYLGEAGAKEIYGRSPKIATCGVFAPLGKGVREGDGYRISGRWPWLSGSMHSTYRLGGFVVPREGGGVDVLHAFFEAGETRMLDTWHTAGLGGTGSHDMEVEGALVPAHRVVTFLGGSPRETGPLYRFPAFGLLATGVAAVALGIARDAVDTFVELARGKRTQGGKRTLAERETIQMHVARATALVDAGRAYLHATVDEAYRVAESARSLEPQHRAALRLAATFATESAQTAVDLVYRAAGGTAVYNTCKLQKHLRDVHVASAHAMVAEPTYALVGRMALGLETDTAQL